MTDLRAFIAERLGKDAVLTKPELVELSTAIGRAPQFWQHLVRHDWASASTCSCIATRGSTSG